MSEVTIRNTRGSGHQQGWGVGISLEAQHLKYDWTPRKREMWCLGQFAPSASILCP